MKRGDIERAALDVYSRVFATSWSAGWHAPFAYAREAYESAIADLEGLSMTVTKRKRAEAIAPTDAAKEILGLFKMRLPRLPQPEEPVSPSVWAVLNAAAKRDPPAVWGKRFALAGRSSFLMGKDGSFCASLPWLLKPSVAADIDGGKYGGMS
jgi:hypothetical protein